MEPTTNPSPEPAAAKVTVEIDVLDLARVLEGTGRYRRDTRLGGILHWRKVSLREVEPEDSVHLVMDGNRLHAHVDRHSPLNFEGRRRWQYSLPGVVAHNLADVVADGFRALVGRRRDHCEFTCERVWVDDGDDAAALEAAGGPLPEGRVPGGE